MQTIQKSQRELVISRVFDAPRELVWKEWTEPERLMRWWGPNGYTTPEARIDFRVGGKYLVCMRSPLGKDIWSTGVYREIVKQQKIVSTDSFADNKGNVVPSTYYGMSGMPIELLVTVTFEDLDGKTLFTLRHAGFPEGEMKESAKIGWNESFDKLAEELKKEGVIVKPVTDNTYSGVEGEREIVVSRLFDAPRDVLFDAWTDPAHIGEWWGPNGFTTDIGRMEVKPGGIWRFVMHGPDGRDYRNRVVYKEISRPDRLVYAHGSDDKSIPEFQQTVLFEEQGGRTKVTMRLLFESTEERDRNVKKNGAIEGGKQTLERLSAYLARPLKDVVISRVFDAPLEFVWKEWSEPERMMQWWGPQYFTAPVIEMDFHAGGRYRWSMRSPEGKDFWNVGEYTVVIPMDRIVYRQYFADEKGNVVPASYYGLPGDWAADAEVTVTVSFEELAGKTKMIIREEGIPAGQMLESAKEGWSSSLDKLAADLKKQGENAAKTGIVAEPGRQEVVITRVFDAPRDLVFKVSTDPKLVPEWWGPRRFTTTVEKMEVRPGGVWRFVQKDKEGNVFAFHGVYHDIKPPERVVQTFEYEGMPGHVLLETVSYEDLNGKTKVTDRSVFESVEDRDGMLSSGMTEGSIESHERLDELLEKLKKGRR